MTTPSDDLDGLPDPASFKNPKALDSEEPSFVSYFGFDAFEKFYLPDGKQYIEFKLMNEGERSHYQSKTTRDMRMHRGSGDASMKIDPSVDRKALLEVSVKNWYIFGPDGQPVQFQPRGAGLSFETFVNKANPKIIDDLVEAITKANPWMQDNVTIELIDEQIADLEKRKTEIRERDAAKS